MKKYPVLLFALCVLLALPAFAAGPDETDGFPGAADTAADAYDDTAVTAPDTYDRETLSVIAGLVSDIANDPSESHVVALRPEEDDAPVPDGLKGLVVSIFGRYAPVTTTAVVTQTVGNDRYQYLIETVASGSAGIDYEWVAGVLLFAILLYCIMRLFGGVLK